MRQACTNFGSISKNTLLAYLSINEDKSKAVVKQTGQVILLSPIMASYFNSVVSQKISDGAWEWASTVQSPQFQFNDQGEVIDLSKTTVKIIETGLVSETRKAILAIPQTKVYLANNIYKYLNNKTWVYFDRAYPRGLLLTNPNWQVVSFNGKTRQVCVNLSVNQKNCVDTFKGACVAKQNAVRHLNFTLQDWTF